MRAGAGDAHADSDQKQRQNQVCHAFLRRRTAQMAEFTIY
jgi:hypothetical protein